MIDFKLKYIQQFGWRKTKGYKIDTSQINDEYDYIFFEKLEDFCEEVDEYYVDDENPELMYEDIDDVIEHIEDHLEDENLHFDNWKALNEPVKEGLP